jgi:hypothetical protein
MVFFRAINFSTKNLMPLIIVWLFTIGDVGAQQVVQGCQIFPSNNIWNKRIDSLPVDAKSATYINTIGKTTNLHPDVGNDITQFGIPYNVVPGTQAKFTVSFDYADESDPGPYPVSTKLLIEGGTWATSNDGDRHVLMVDATNKKLYELYYTFNQGGNNYHAGSGAIWNLTSNKLRPNGWTSADAAGLPVFAGLLNYDETASGVVHHALRFTCRRTDGYIWPARHKAGTQTTGYPPNGQRFRLKASYNISGFSKMNQTILTALKQYGMFVADNGSDWFLTGAPDKRWNNTDLDQLKKLTGNDFEAVNESSLMVSADSAQCK